MSERGDVPTRAAAAVRSNAAALPLVVGLGLAGTTVVANVLTTVELAAFLVVLSIRGTVQFITDMGSGTASARAFARLEHAGAKHPALALYARLGLIRIVLILVLLGAVLTFPQPLHDALGDDLDTETAVTLVLAMVGIEVFASLGFYTLTGLLRHDLVNRIAIAQAIVQPLTIIALVAAGFGLTGALVGLLVGSLLRGLALHICAFQALQAIQSDDPAGAADADPERLTPTAVAAGAGKLASFAHSRQLISLKAASVAPAGQFVLFALAYDLTHQALTPVVNPVGSVLGPSLATVGDADRSAGIASTAIRVLLLGTVGVAAAFTLAIGFVDDAVFGPQFADMDLYVLILAPAVAIELALTVPMTAVMLASDPWLRAYRTIKLATLAAAGVYFAVGLSDLLLVLALMAAIRLASALALAIVYHRRQPLRLPGAWLAGLALTAAAAGAIGWGLGTAVGGGIAGGIAGTAALGLVYLAGLRFAGLVYVEDLATFGRVLPGSQERLGRLFAARSIAAAV